MKAPEDSHFVARFARWSHRIVASPFAPVVTLLLILIALTFRIASPLGRAERYLQAEAAA